MKIKLSAPWISESPERGIILLPWTNSGIISISLIFLFDVQFESILIFVPTLLNKASIAKY